MRLKIPYESKYSLSTVSDGENIITSMKSLSKNSNNDVSEIFKKDNSYLENIKLLNNYYPNYKYADITINTVLGILCRLIGEVRRLDCLNDNHPILKLKDKITFKNFNSSFQNELILIHTPEKEVQDNAGGIIPSNKENHFLLTENNLSNTLLSVFNLKDKNEIIDFLKKVSNNDNSLFYTKFNRNIKKNTFIKEMHFSVEKQKDIIPGFYFKDNDIVWKEIKGRLFKGKELDILMLENEIMSNIDNKKFNITDKRKELNVDEIFYIYGVLFALKIKYLINNKLFEKEFKNSLNKDKSSIKGLAPNSGSLTIKDFYTNFVNKKKLSWYMPYQVELKKDLFKKEDIKEFNTFAKMGITKECGYLEIYIDINKEEAFNLFEKIDNAGVNTFHLGKKGLAYIEKIDLE